MRILKFELNNLAVVKIHLILICVSVFDKFCGEIAISERKALK